MRWKDISSGRNSENKTLNSNEGKKLVRKKLANFEPRD